MFLATLVEDRMSDEFTRRFGAAVAEYDLKASERRDAERAARFAEEGRLHREGQIRDQFRLRMVQALGRFRQMRGELLREKGFFFTEYQEAVFDNGKYLDEHVVQIRSPTIAGIVGAPLRFSV